MYNEENSKFWECSLILGSKT